jgi:subtilase family serine protease
MRPKRIAFVKSVGAVTVSTVLLASVVGVSLTQGIRTSRIRGQIDVRSLSVVRGHLHPLAGAEFDEGAVDSAMPMSRVTMVFKRTDAQQADLDALLQQQQDPSSANYHVWLTPEEFGDRFGLDHADVDKIVSWLRSQGFTVDEPPVSRSWVTFSGTANQVNTALHTDIHAYLVNGVRHYAPAREPAVPTALASVVSGFRALHDFRMKPRVMARRVDFTSSLTGNHFLVPDDVATIYDFKTLYGSGINGTGQSIAVIGQTDILLSDISTFRQNANLPANPPTVILVPGSGDPGISSSDLPEADIDLEWSGAMAPNARIIYVNSGNGVFDSLQYTIDHNLAPIVSTSYGDCEPNFAASDINFLATLGQQANAQGMTILAPSGDAGATDCDGDFPNRLAAQLGLSVDLPASLPYATAVGATTLFDVKGNYWSPANNGNSGSAISYIPEVPWNDTLVFAIAGLAGTGGGRSANFSKPTWQVGPGVANDRTRDIPDVSLSGSGYDPYLICSGGSCVNGFRAADSSLFAVSGTSVTTPVFAAIVALINQRMTTPQGNVNPGLYKLAETTPGAFHDITTGGNWMPCQQGTPNCPHGGLLGYSAGRGYDMVTGIGSIDAFRIVTGWPLP